MLLENFPNTTFDSRNSIAIDNSRLVTDLVTVNGNSADSISNTFPSVPMMFFRNSY